MQKREWEQEDGEEWCLMLSSEYFVADIVMNTSWLCSLAEALHVWKKGKRNVDRRAIVGKKKGVGKSGGGYEGWIWSQFIPYKYKIVTDNFSLFFLSLPTHQFDYFTVSSCFLSVCITSLYFLSTDFLSGTPLNKLQTHLLLAAA